MSLPTIDINSFKGFYKLPKANPADLDYLNDYISEFYPQIVRDLIGDEAFISIDGETPLLTPKWLDLLNGTTYQNTILNKEVKQGGLINSILGLLYFHYVRDYFQPTDSGNVENLQEVSANLGEQKAVINITRWNRSIKLLCEEIAPFVIEYSQVKTEILSSTENTPTNYTINVNETTYLSDNDTVIINNQKYLVSNVVENDSFDITAGAGLDFSGLTVTWEPFKDFPLLWEIPYIYNVYYHKSVYYNRNVYLILNNTKTKDYDFISL